MFLRTGVTPSDPSPTVKVMSGIERSCSQNFVAHRQFGISPIASFAEAQLEIDREVEEAAASLGARRWRVVTRVILPYLYPAWLTGFALAFARAVGEYGSVIFISGNLPMVTQITPLVIMTKLEQFDYPGATAVALVLLVLSFVLLLAVNALQGWAARRVTG